MREPVPQPIEPRPWWRLALVWLVGLSLLAWLLHQVPFQTLRQVLGSASPGVWALTCAGLALSYGWRAARLQVVLGLDERAGGRRWIGLRLDALRVILMHNAAVNLLPMRAGELSFPWLAAKHLGMPLDASVASLLWMRLQDLAVLLALGLLMWPGLDLWWRLAGLALLVIGWHAGIWLLRGLHGRLPASSPSAQAPSTLARLIGRFHTAMLDPHHHRWSAWALTWANWTTKLAAGACLLAALTQHPWREGWAGALGGELAAVVPIQGPAGFGTYEAGVWAAYALHTTLHTGAGTANTSAIVPAALALHLCFLLCAVTAGLLAWITPSWSTPHLPD